MQNITTHIENLSEKTKDYVETTLSLFKLQATDFIADTFSSLVSKALLILVLSMFLLFFNVGLSFCIGSLLNSNHLGFIIVSFVYLLIALILFFMKDKWIINPVNNIIISGLKVKKVNSINFETNTNVKD